MKRGVYSALWWAALPAVLGRLWWRGRKEPGYRRHWRERLALYRARRYAGRPTSEARYRELTRASELATGQLLLARRAAAHLN